MRRLLDAGACPTIADRKGVRPCDLGTWTSVLHAALMAPLQDRTVQLQQANAALARRTHELLARTRNVRDAIERVDARAQDMLAHAHAAAACRAHMELQIQHAQLAVDRLALDTRAETPKAARLHHDLRQLHLQRDGAQHDVDQSRADAAEALQARERVLEVHASQRVRLQAAADESAVRCEVIALARRFRANESLQAQTMQSLLALCRRSPGTTNQTCLLVCFARLQIHQDAPSLSPLTCLNEQRMHSKQHAQSSFAMDSSRSCSRPCSASQRTSASS